MQPVQGSAQTRPFMTLVASHQTTPVSLHHLKISYSIYHVLFQLTALATHISSALLHTLHLPGLQESPSFTHQDLPAFTQHLLNARLCLDPGAGVAIEVRV